MAKVLISIPDRLLYRMKHVFPARQRSFLIVAFLEKEVQQREKQLFEAAAAVENDATLRHEIEEWDVTLTDGLEEDESR